mgnify:CR=1 FL=1
MVAKDEAKDLYEKFFLQTEYYINLGCEELAKENALICVDWHLKEFIDTYGDDLIDNIEYWEEVKKEINKL